MTEPVNIDSKFYQNNQNTLQRRKKSADGQKSMLFYSYHFVVIEELIITS